jgi:hypothetical protein
VPLPLLAECGSISAIGSLGQAILNGWAFSVPIFNPGGADEGLAFATISVFVEHPKHPLRTG